jgi:predicted RecA/RadA family phage recombinase
LTIIKTEKEDLKMPVLYKHSEPVWDYTAGGSGATAGDVVLLGANDDVIGIVVADIEANGLGAVRVTGVYSLPTEETGMVQGDEAYWDADDEVITDDTSDVYAGRCAGRSAGGKVLVSINFMWPGVGS